jgi:hypothetical protein
MGIARLHETGVLGRRGSVDGASDNLERQSTMQRPARGEYADYYHQYIEKVGDGDIGDILEAQRQDFVSRVKGIPAALGDHRYAEGKWSVKEVVGHVIDVERVFGYRMMAFARGDKTPLPSMEQDEYAAGGKFGARTLEDLAEEFSHLRSSHLTLIRSLDDEVSARTGTASGFEFTVRAIAYVLAGHAEHHLGVLAERYLQGATE